MLTMGTRLASRLQFDRRPTNAVPNTPECGLPRSPAGSSPGEPPPRRQRSGWLE